MCSPRCRALAALAGAFFQKFTLELRARQKRSNLMPGWLKPALGALVVWILAVAVFAITRHVEGAGRLGVFSLGYDDLTSGINNQLPWKIAALLLLAKLPATIASYGFAVAAEFFRPRYFSAACAACSWAG